MRSRRIAMMTLPAGMRANLIVDQSEFIVENVEEVEVSLLFGGAMAILIILVFLLDWRSTFISSLTLPTSVVITPAAGTPRMVPRASVRGSKR